MVRTSNAEHRTPNAESRNIRRRRVATFVGWWGRAVAFGGRAPKGACSMVVQLSRCSMLGKRAGNRVKAPQSAPKRTIRAGLDAGRQGSRRGRARAIVVVPDLGVL